MRRFAVVFISGMVMATTVHAAGCAPTPRLATANYPGAAQIPFGNDLLQPAGKAVAADGQRITIIGRLVDKACVPIAGATVELWQANPFGRYGVATPAERVTPSPSFAGAGRATTDNDGNFYFITAFPAPVGKRAPHVNIRVLAEGMEDFSTVLYFGDDKRNATDELLKGKVAREPVTIAVAPGENNALQGTIRIVLPQKAIYRTY